MHMEDLNIWPVIAEIGEWETELGKEEDQNMNKRE